ncbi:hypothetical protein ACWGII_03960 [Streptomyces sp. NPDC054855]
MTETTDRTDVPQLAPGPFRFGYGTNGVTGVTGPTGVRLDGALGPALLTAALAPAARKFGRKVSVT